MSDAYYDIADGGSASAIRAGLNTMNRKLVNVSLPVEVAITDADVEMVADREYRGSIAGFTANRNYDLPAGVAGQRVRVSIAEGDDTYALIVRTPGNVELTRLRITNEYIIYRCHATNDWRIEVDGRIPMRGLLIAASSVSVNATTWTQILFDTATSNSNIADHTNDRFNIWRNCNALVTLRWIHAGSNAQSIQSITKNGATISPDTRIAQNVYPGSNGVSLICGGICTHYIADLVAGDTLSAILYNNFTGTASTFTFDRPLFTFEEILK